MKFQRALSIERSYRTNQREWRRTTIKAKLIPSLMNFISVEVIPHFTSDPIKWQVEYTEHHEQSEFSRQYCLESIAVQGYWFEHEAKPMKRIVNRIETLILVYRTGKVSSFSFDVFNIFSQFRSKIKQESCNRETNSYTN